MDVIRDVSCENRGPLSLETPQNLPFSPKTRSARPAPTVDHSMTRDLEPRWSLSRIRARPAPYTGRLTQPSAKRKDTAHECNSCLRAGRALTTNPTSSNRLQPRGPACSALAAFECRTKPPRNGCDSMRPEWLKIIHAQRGGPRLHMTRPINAAMRTNNIDWSEVRRRVVLLPRRLVHLWPTCEGNRGGVLCSCNSSDGFLILTRALMS